MSEPLTIISPADGSRYFHGYYAEDGAVAAAVAAGSGAAVTWRMTPVKERIEMLDTFVAALCSEATTLSLMTAWHMGRPIAKADETEDLKFIFDYYKSTVGTFARDVTLPGEGGEHRSVERVPYGVNLSICAWNYPVVMLSSLILAPLLAGNVVIFKHSPQTARITEVISRAAAAARLPSGVLQALDMTHGQSDRLHSSGAIALVSFVGSTRGGLEVRRAAAPAFVHQILELGGKDAAYVREDADLETAAKQLVRAAFTNSGQSCCSVERIYVDARIHDGFVEHFVDQAKRWTVGHPVLGDAALGPVVSAAAATRINAEVADALAAGAREQLEAVVPDLPGGAYVAPRVLTNVNHDMPIMRNETFGPVAPIMAVNSDDEAITLMNDSAYGLTGSIWTKDLEHGLALCRRVNAGNVYVNEADYVDLHLPWGGTGISGLGKTDGFSWVKSLTRVKGYFAVRVSEAVDAQEGAMR